jgi:hypothetical protein
MRFTVPQFIEIEDRIFGPLTWKQFLYVSGGFGMALVLFLTTPFIVFVLIGVPIGLLAAALAFYPINNRPFSEFLESAFNYFTNQREYYWRRGRDIVYSEKHEGEATTNAPTKPQSADKISSLSRRLELEALQKTEE